MRWWDLATLAVNTFNVIMLLAIGFLYQQRVRRLQERVLALELTMGNVVMHLRRHQPVENDQQPIN